MAAAHTAADTGALHGRHWPRRVPHAIATPATPLSHNLVVSAQRYPDKPALVFFGRTLSYGALQHQVERLAAHLHQMGVARGDRVILLMQNCPQWVVAHFAILRANAVVVPVNPMNRADELAHYITDADARVAVVAADLAAELVRASDALPAGQGLRHVVVSHYRDTFEDSALDDGRVPAAWREWLGTRHQTVAPRGGATTGWQEALANGWPAPELQVGPEDLAVLPYTSGTTGLPKGCIHPHRTVMHNAVASALWTQLCASHTALGVAPLFHITGLVGLHAGLYAGATVVMMPRWDRELAGALISQWRATHWSNIPTMVMDLLASPNFDRFDLSSLVSIGGGGAAMPQAVAQRLFDLYGLRYQEGYGLTETAAPSHYNPPDHPKQQCLGVPFVGVTSLVVDPVTLAPMPQGETGEIVMHGPGIFSGYWKNPEATAAVFFEHEGLRFFRSGDLGHIDEDGYFFITDRLKRMINASGFKVWPAEVEALMFKHPAIAEACVIATRDDYRGESVKAVVVLRAEARGTLGEADIVAWCREHMAVYKAPRVVQFTDALPKSGSGKVMWRALQEQEDSAAQSGA